MTFVSTVLSVLVVLIVLLLLWTVWRRSCQRQQPNLIVDGRLSGSAATAPSAGKPVIIIGAGITGLILAYELSKARIPFVILEAKSHIGGRVMTLKYADGTTSEAPLEEYWERSPIVALLRELNVPVLKSGAHSSVLMEGKIVVGRGDPNVRDYLSSLFTPSEEEAFLSWNDEVWRLYQDLHKSFWTHYDSLHELVHSPSSSSLSKQPQEQDGGFAHLNAGDLAALVTALSNRLPLPDHLRRLMSQSFADFVQRSRLPHKVSEWIRFTLEAEIATDWDEISALDGIDEFRLFLNTPDGFGETNYHVQGGNVNFIKALASRLPPGSIHTRCTVTQINQSGRVQVVYIQEDDTNDMKNGAVPQSEQVRVLEGSHVVCTVPVHELHHIRFHPALDRPRLAAIHSTRMGSYVKVSVRLQKAAATLWAKYGDDIFTLLTDRVCGAIYNSTHAASSADKRDLTLTVLLHGSHAKRLIDGENDGDIETHVRKQLEDLFPGISTYIDDVEVFTFPHAVAHWPLALGRSRFDALANHLRSPMGHVFLAGDTTVGSHSEGAAWSALAIAKQLKKSHT